MKNKFFALILALCMLACALTGCAPGNISVRFDSPYPWAQTGTELAKYSVVIEEVDNKGNGTGKILANGIYTTQIQNDYYVTESLIRYGRVDTSFTLTYTQDANEVDRGKTDVLTAWATFQMNNMATNQSYREYNVAERNGETSLFSHKIEMNYFEGTGVLTTYDGQTPVQQEMTFNQGTYYDNEQWLYLSRAQDLNVMRNFTMTSAFDSFKNNKRLTTYTMGQSPSAMLVGKEVSIDKTAFVVPEEPEQRVDVEENQIPCYEVTLGISATKSGAPTILYYSYYDYKIGEASNKKILVEFYTYIYEGLQLKAKVTYTLTNIS